MHALVGEYLDFVWRSLRRLGVSEADCDDGCQRVWLVVTRKLDTIRAGKERTFIFSVVLRVAADMRRAARRSHEVEFEERFHQDAAACPEQPYEQRRARELLDAMLAPLSWELRTAFVMFELEGFSTPEIAHLLGVSRGTIASRLRLARERFSKSIGDFQLAQRPPERDSGTIFLLDPGDVEDADDDCHQESEPAAKHGVIAR